MFMDKNIDLKLKRLLYIICWLALIGAGMFILSLIKGVLSVILNVLSPFILGGILAYIFNPVVTHLQRKLRLGRVMGIVVFAIIVIIALVIFIGIVLPIIYNQAVNLIDLLRTELPSKIDTLWQKLGAKFLSEEDLAEYRTRLDKLSIDVKTAFTSTLPHLKTAAEGSISIMGKLAKGLASGVMYLVSLTTMVALSLIVCFYILIDTGKVRKIIQTLTPDDKESRLFDILEKINKNVGGFLRGQLIVCGIIGILTAIGLFAIGLREYAVLIGFCAGMATIVPYLGPVIGATPAILWALFTTHYTSVQERLVGIALIVGLFVLIQTLDGIIISPKIVGKTSELHPLVVLLAILIGAQFGLIGLILAVPAACVVKVLFLEFIWNNLVEKEAREKSQAS